jgi:hypothetical protein
MARILPDVSAATGPWAKPRQRFFPKVESSSDKALKIMQAISGGVRTASDLYGLGMDIYDRTKETPEEALVRRQEELGDPATRQNIARNQLGGGMVGDEYDPMLGKGPADLSGFRQAQEEFAQDFAATDQETFIPDREKGLPFTETQAPVGAAPSVSAQVVPVTEGRVIAGPAEFKQVAPSYGIPVELLKNVPRELWPTKGETYEGYAERSAAKIEAAGFAMGSQQPGLAAPAATTPVADDYEAVAARWATMLDRVEKSGHSDAIPYMREKAIKAAGDSGRSDLESAFVEGLTDTSAIAAAEYITGQAQPGLLNQPRTAPEFAAGLEAGREFTVEELNLAYRSAFAAGRQEEADELVQLAVAAQDIGRFALTGTEPKALIRARAKDAVRKGAAGGRAFTNSEAISLSRMDQKKKKRGNKLSGRKFKRPTGPDPKGDELTNRPFLIYAARNGLTPARNVLYPKGGGPPTRHEQGNLAREARAIVKGLTSTTRSGEEWRWVEASFGTQWWETPVTEAAAIEATEATAETEKGNIAKAAKALGVTNQKVADWKAGTGEWKAADALKAMEETLRGMPESGKATRSDYSRPENETTAEYNAWFNEDRSRLAREAANSPKLKKGRIKEREALKTKVLAAKNALNALGE